MQMADEVSNRPSVFSTKNNIEVNQNDIIINKNNPTSPFQ
jgi:hypothetical protein